MRQCPTSPGADDEVSATAQGALGGVRGAASPSVEHAGSTVDGATGGAADGAATRRGAAAYGAADVSPVALVSAAPFVALLAYLEAETARLRAWVPGSDVPGAMAAVAGHLRSALREGAEADLWVTTDEVARLRGISRSTVTWRINHGHLKAEWRGGRWWVHRADVEGT